jgi:hypothetical protein
MNAAAAVKREMSAQRATKTLRRTAVTGLVVVLAITGFRLVFADHPIPPTARSASLRDRAARRVATELQRFEQYLLASAWGRAPVVALADATSVPATRTPVGTPEPTP